ncbi:alpha-hydroxy-acid oxidizing protein [Paraburkholderia sp. IMGN_8]|uniref:alpha-hydroxy-acid oxidizing protein n=1 Tax=Paraburkholderia sp. IMGN_8 TaxID=3136564 RepID=UPI003100EE9B
MKRHLSSPAQFYRACNVDGLRLLARRRLPNFAFEYLGGGADDEVTMRANRSAFERWRFVPKAREIDRTLGQLGCPSIDALGPKFLRAA